MLSHNTFLSIFNQTPYAVEFEFYFSNTDETYMLIKFENSVSFARCGSEELFYPSFEELYNNRSVDDICLAESWDTINSICIDTLFSLPEDLDKLCQAYNIYI